MKTTGFRTLVLGTPWRNLTYLIIETDEGITGIGEARILQGHLLVSEMGPQMGPLQQEISQA